MPALTRRRSDNPHHVTWHAYFGDIRMGTIGERAGVPVDVDQWQWRCGFYPGSEPGEHRHGTATDFFTGRREFEAAWREFSAKKTEADYQEWRDQRDRTVRKYASWARGEKPPPPSSMMRCACGVRFDSHVLPQKISSSCRTSTPRKQKAEHGDRQLRPDLFQHPDRSHTSNTLSVRSRTQLANSLFPVQVSTALLFWSVTQSA